MQQQLLFKTPQQLAREASRYQNQYTNSYLVKPYSGIPLQNHKPLPSINNRLIPTEFHNLPWGGGHSRRNRSRLIPPPLTTKTYDQSGTSRVSTRSLYSDPLVSNGEGERIALRVDSGHSAINTWINKVTWWIKKKGTVSGNYEYTVRNTSGTLLTSTNATATSLSTSYAQVELTLDDYIKLAIGDMVCVEYDSTARTADGVDVGTSSANWEANTTQRLYSTAGGWVDDPDGNIGRKYMVTFDSSPTI